MLGTLVRLFTNGSDLLGAEVRLATARLAKVGAALVALLVLAAIGALGLVALGVGAAGALAPDMGWPGAIAAVGGAALLLVAIGLWTLIASLRRALQPIDRADGAPSSPEPAPTPTLSADAPAPDDDDVAQARRDISAARKRLHRALRAGGPRAGRADGPSVQDLSLKAIDAAVRNPEAIAAGVFALASVVGPGRMFRAVTRTAGAVSMAATVVRIARREINALQRSGAAKANAPSNGAARWSAS